MAIDSDTTRRLSNYIAENCPSSCEGIAGDIPFSSKTLIHLIVDMAVTFRIILPAWTIFYAVNHENGC